MKGRPLRGRQPLRVRSQAAEREAAETEAAEREAAESESKAASASATATLASIHASDGKKGRPQRTDKPNKTTNEDTIEGASYVFNELVPFL